MVENTGQLIERQACYVCPSCGNIISVWPRGGSMFAPIIKCRRGAGAACDTEMILAEIM